MQGEGDEDVLPVLLAPENTAKAVSCEWIARSQTPVWERIPGSSSFQTRVGNAAQPVLKGMKQELQTHRYPNGSLGTSTKLVTTY